MLIASCSSMIQSYEIKYYTGAGITVKNDITPTGLDFKTNLVWKDDDNASSAKRNWYAAVDYCKGLNIDNNNDWRLPSSEELKTIMDINSSNERQSKFNNASVEDYWSSSTSNSMESIGVNLKSGESNVHSNNQEYNFRCVRYSTESADLNEVINKYSSRAGGNREILQASYEFFKKYELNLIQKPSKTVENEKGEFESTQEYDTRVKKNKQVQDQKMKEYKLTVRNSDEIANKYAIKNALIFVWGTPQISNLKYNADDEYFTGDLIFEPQSNFNKKIIIKVKREDAKEFKENFKDFSQEVVFDYSNGTVTFKELNINYHLGYKAQILDMKADESRFIIKLKSEPALNQDALFDAEDVTIKNAKKMLDDGKNAVAFKMLNELCSKKNLSACYQLGLCYQGGVGVIQDIEKAIELYTIACDGNIADACNNLGAVESNSDEYEEPEGDAAYRRFYKKACDGGSATGCYNLSNQYIMDEPKRMKLLVKACKGGYKDACDEIHKITTYQKFYPSGKLAVSGKIINHKLDGVVKGYYESGILYQKLTIKDGILNGLTTIYDMNGKLFLKIFFKNGKAISGEGIVGKKITNYTKDQLNSITLSFKKIQDIRK